MAQTGRMGLIDVFVFPLLGILMIREMQMQVVGRRTPVKVSPSQRAGAVMQRQWYCLRRPKAERIDPVENQVRIRAGRRASAVVLKRRPGCCGR